jgi:hypothetical protein
MQSITLGDVTVTRITEWKGCAPVTAQLASEGGREVVAPSPWSSRAS